MSRRREFAIEFERAAGPLEDRLAAALAKIALAARHELRRTAMPHGLSPVQAQILASLAEAGAQEAGRISERLGLTPATISDSVAALERRRLVDRSPRAEDRRRVLVSPTEEGRTIGRSVALWPEFMASSLRVLSAAEQEVLMRAVSRLVLDLIERGSVQEARMCVNCVHFRPRIHPDPERPHHCALVDVPLGDRALRFDCPDHLAVQPAEAWKRLEVSGC